MLTQDEVDHYESMLFNYETTSRTAYRYGTIKPLVKTKHKPKAVCLRKRPRPLKDSHTLSNWKVPNVPFNLMHKPNGTLLTNPWKAQEPFSKPEDKIEEHVRRTRPRLVMTPAVSLDDIGDRSVREMLIDDMYMTSNAKAARDSGIANKSSVRLPLSRTVAPTNPIRLSKLQVPYVSPEWRMDSVSWDSRQMRCYCDPTREFWLNKRPKY